MLNLGRTQSMSQDVKKNHFVHGNALFISVEQSMFNSNRIFVLVYDKKQNYSLYNF